MIEIPTMLTIDETAERFGLAKHFVYRCVKENRVVYVRAGKKYLINAQSFCSFLNTGEQSTPVAESAPECGTIRRII